MSRKTLAGQGIVRLKDHSAVRLSSPDEIKLSSPAPWLCLSTPQELQLLQGVCMYYYRDGIHSVGPFTKEKLIELHRKQIINDQSLVRSEDSDAWFEYSRVSLSLSEPSSPGRAGSEFSGAPEMAVAPHRQTRVNDTDFAQQAESGWVLSPVAPWRRYFARAFDLTVFSLLAWFLVGYAWYSVAPLDADNFFNQTNPFVDAILTLFMGSVISGLVLGFVGTTPGKSIFGIRVRNLQGDSIGLVNGIGRDLTVFFKGLGLGIPVISLITLILSYRQLKHKQVMSWDEGRYTVSYRPNSWTQISLSIAGIALYAVIIGLITALNQIP